MNYYQKIKLQIYPQKKRLLFIDFLYIIELELNEEEGDDDYPFSYLFKKSISYTQLKSIISAANSETSKFLFIFLYKNFKPINEILYEKQKQIEINEIFFDNDKGILIKAFYLDLLVNSDEMMIWYVYDFTLIENLMKILNKYKKNN